MRSPLLEKIRVAFCLMSDLGQGTIVHFGSRLLDWSPDGPPYGSLVQGPDTWEIEETLRVALGLP